MSSELELGPAPWFPAPPNVPGREVEDFVRDVVRVVGGLALITIVEAILIVLLVVFH